MQSNAQSKLDSSRDSSMYQAAPPGVELERVLLLFKVIRIKR